MCVDYTKAITAADESTAAETTASAQAELPDDPTEPAAADILNGTTNTDKVYGSEPNEETGEGDGTAQNEAKQGTRFFENTTLVLCTCCVGAVIIALTAAVILLIIKRKTN